MTWLTLILIQQQQQQQKSLSSFSRQFSNKKQTTTTMNRLLSLFTRESGDVCTTTMMKLSANPKEKSQRTQQKKEDLESYLDLERYSSLGGFHHAMETLCEQCIASSKKRSRNSNIDVLSMATLIQTMWEKALITEEGVKKKWEPNHITFSLVLKGWSKAAVSLVMEPDRGRAKTIQEKMVFSFLEEESHDYQVVSAVDAMNHAEELLLDYLQNHDTKSKDILHGINVVVDGWAKIARYSLVNDGNNKDSNDSAEEQQHQHHLTPNQAAQKAEDLFQKIFNPSKQSEEDEEEDSSTSDETAAVNTVIMKPDMITYTSLIEAWASTDYEKAEALVEKLIQSYVSSSSFKDDGTVLHEEQRPTVRLANCLMHAHAKTTATIMEEAMRLKSYDEEQKKRKFQIQRTAWKHARQAHSILRRWKELYEEHDHADFQPDVTSYTTVMDAYAKCAQIEAVKEAEKLLKEIEDLHAAHPKNPSLQPNTKTYTTMITAWSRTNVDQSSRKAQGILERMKEMSKQSGSLVKPNTRTFTSVISSWARSNDPTKAGRALKLLKEMQDTADSNKDGEDIRPTTFTYNAVLDACAKTRGSNEQLSHALKIAFAIHKSMIFHSKKGNGSVTPNHITYATLFKTTHKLIPESGGERNSIVKALFENAKRAGQIDRYVITNLQLAADVDLFRELMDPITDRNGYMHYDDLPQDWCKNVSRNIR
mmetsp:Transcript_9028/g.8611  ORF Transcript_9028/g.8611 Transcript_9028/m.8611 type:complete len:706 (-) Transcript_9028:112-2229(-)